MTTPTQRSRALEKDESTLRVTHIRYALPPFALPPPDYYHGGNDKGGHNDKSNSATVMHAAPLGLSLIHQVGALTLFALALRARHEAGWPGEERIARS